MFALTLLFIFSSLSFICSGEQRANWVLKSLKPQKIHPEATLQLCAFLSKHLWEGKQNLLGRLMPATLPPTSLPFIYFTSHSSSFLPSLQNALSSNYS